MGGEFELPGQPNLEPSWSVVERVPLASPLDVADVSLSPSLHWEMQEGDSYSHSFAIQPIYTVMIITETYNDTVVASKLECTKAVGKEGMNRHVLHVVIIVLYTCQLVVLCIHMLHLSSPAQADEYMIHKLNVTVSPRDLGSKTREKEIVINMDKLSDLTYSQFLCKWIKFVPENVPARDVVAIVSQVIVVL